MRGRPRMVAAGHPGERHAVRARTGDRFLDGERAGGKGQSIGCVDQAGSAFLRDDPGHGAAVDPADAQVRGVLRDARDAVRGKPLGIGGDERLRRRLCSRGVGAGRR